MVSLPAPSQWVEPEKNWLKLLPMTEEYYVYWRMIKRRSIEGYWLSGTWIAPLTYSYCNNWTIKIQLGEGSAEQNIRPLAREIDFDKGWVYAEARGFSGFAEDDEYTCDRVLIGYKEGISKPISKTLKPYCYNKAGVLKKYMSARERLRNTTTNLGKALYKNPSLNILDIEARSGGKSYWGAHAIWHVSHFDGATDYDLWMEKRDMGKPMSAQVLVSAIDTKYSNDLISKVLLGMQELPGQQRLGSKLYPAPFALKYEGSFTKEVEFIERVKIGNNWQVTGSHSKITHRTYSKSATAANGLRPALAVIEEVGFCDKLTDVLSALETCVAPNSNRFGTVMMFGTGGLNDLAGIKEVHKVFYNPELYHCLAFDDTWEGTGKIGYFVPQPLTLMKYYDPETGKIDAEAGTAEVERELAEMQSRGANKKDIDLFKTNKPLTPSDALMSVEGNTFPVDELKRQLGWLRTKPDLGKFAPTYGTMVFKNNTYTFEADSSFHYLPYPLPQGTPTKGCVTIWETPYRQPGGGIPNYLYVAGCDPYDHDQSTTGSLGSTFILKRFHPNAGRPDMIVAEYTARPEKHDDYHEMVRRLLIYYNATLLHENERNSIVDHFRYKSSLHLLAPTPTFLTALERSKVQRKYGLHPQGSVKSELETYLRDWLLEEHNGIPNYATIYSESLLAELIAYNREGNFDRGIAMLMTICHMLSLRRQPVREKKPVEQIKPIYQNLLYT